MKRTEQDQGKGTVVEDGLLLSVWSVKKASLPGDFWTKTLRNERVDHTGVWRECSRWKEERVQMLGGGSVSGGELDQRGDGRRVCLEVEGSMVSAFLAP